MKLTLSDIADCRVPVLFVGLDVPVPTQQHLAAAMRALYPTLSILMKYIHSR